MTKVNLGDKVQDKVTGYEGIATARVEYLNGCTQYGVSGKVDKDGKVPDVLYIDHSQLEVVVDKKVVVEARDTGGATTRGLRTH